MCAACVKVSASVISRRIGSETKLRKQPPKESDSSSEVSKRSGRQLSVWHTHTKEIISYGTLQMTTRLSGVLSEVEKFRSSLGTDGFFPVEDSQFHLTSFF